MAKVIAAGKDQVSTAALAGMAAVCSAVLAVWLKAWPSTSTAALSLSVAASPV